MSADPESPPAEPAAAPAAPGESAAEASGRRFETTAGLTLAVFAAALAITDLGGGKFGDDEIIGTNERANLYAWYQSKGIKQGLVEQEIDLLQALLEGGVVQPDARPALEARVETAQKKVHKYELEKAELLKGSAAVGPDGQIIEIDGQKGQVVGAEGWEAKLATLGRAGDRFDLATLWLQLCMVFGAIALVLDRPALKRAFFATMVGLGLVGSVFAVLAWQIALSA
jgi:hypothetical protein